VSGAAEMHAAEEASATSLEAYGLADFVLNTIRWGAALLLLCWPCWLRNTSRRGAVLRTHDQEAAARDMQASLGSRWPENRAASGSLWGVLHPLAPRPGGRCRAWSSQGRGVQR
jgi:hypothetical protein